MTFVLVFMRHDKAKCVNRKLNVADFHCKHKEGYTLKFE